MVADRKLAGGDVHEYPGGGGINVARVITRFGGKAQALWSCGGDTGSRLGRLLDSEHLSHRPILIDGEVRQNVIVTDRSTGEQYRFGMPGPRLSEEERLRWIEALRAIPTSVEYVVISGSLPDAAPVDCSVTCFGLCRAERESSSTPSKTRSAAYSRSASTSSNRTRESSKR